MSVGLCEFYFKTICLLHNGPRCLSIAQADDNMPIRASGPLNLSLIIRYVRMTSVAFAMVFLFVQASNAAGVFHEGQECSRILADHSKKPTPVESNDFTNNRILDEYKSFFTWKNFDLITILGNLGPHSVWIDMGSGRNIALVKGLALFKQISLGIGINAVRPEFPVGDERVPGRLKTMEGMIEDLSDQGQFVPFNGNVALITDVFGPFSYSLHLKKVMQIYVDLLAKDGQLLMAFQISRAENKSRLDASHEADIYNGVKFGDKWDQRGLISWLKTIPGISVETIEQETFQDHNQYNHTVGVRITKQIAQVEVPDTLQFLDHQETVPYRRLFQRR